MSAELSVTIFLLSVNIAIIGLPFVKDFARNEFLNLLLKRACWTLGIYLTLLSVPIVAGIAEDNTVAGSTELLNVHLWIFGWGGYLFLAFFILKTLFDLFTLWHRIVSNRRMGDES